MVIKEMYNWTIIYTDHKSQFIHLDHLKNSNPDAQIILANISFDIKDKLYAWRNCDYLYRQWFKTNKSIIAHDNVAILEWDVLVSQKLPNIKINGLGARYLIDPNKSKWHWFKEISRLENYKQYATGVAPLGVLFMNKLCIDILLDKEFDTMYDKDIFCELRLPTLLKSKNILITEHFLPYVEWKTTTLTNKPGIYHPIKTKQTRLDKPIRLV